MDGVAEEEVEVAAALVDFRVGEEAGEQGDDREAGQRTSSQAAGGSDGIRTGSVATSQCRKCRRPVKTIEAPALSTAATTSASRFEPPGWMIARTPAASASCGPSANGKNASEASTAPVEVVPVLARLLERDPHRVDAAHLAGADPDRLQVLGEHDRVRGDVLGHAPREEEVAPLRLVGSPQTTSIPSRSSTSESRSWTSRPPSTRR